MRYKTSEFLKKMRRTQNFEHFSCSGKILSTNALHIFLPFPLQKRHLFSTVFQFLFSHSSPATIIHFLTLSAEAHCFFPGFPVFFQPQRTVLKFSAHSRQNYSAQQRKLQCATKKKTVR